jgi:hypothetical protein
LVGGGVLGLGVEHASHVRDETGFRRVHVGHDHSVGTERGGSSSAVRSITSDFGIVLGIGFVDDEGIGLVFVFAEGGIDLAGRDAIPGGIEVEVGVEMILLGPAVSS